MERVHPVALISCVALAASAASAQIPAAQVKTSRNVALHNVVTAQGATIEPYAGSGALATGAVTSGSQNLTTPAQTWQLNDNGLAWIGTAVALGNRSSEVFTEVDLNNERAMLLSCYDSNPPTPVWSDLTAQGTEFRSVASATVTDTKVAIHQVVLGGNPQTRQAVLSRYGSASSVPQWTYTFAPIINAASNVGISRDGTKIVASIYNNNLNQVEIAVFGPSSNIPVSYTIVPVAANDYVRGWDLSSDGSTLYFSAGVTVHIFDVASTTDIFQTVIGASFDSHAISGNGSVFAYGNFGFMSVWEKSGGTYINTHTQVIPGGSNYVAEIDISDDSSTIAYGVTFYSNYLQTTVEALDVATKQLTMSHTATGSGTAQNIISDVSISADGSRFAVGRWGDAAGLINEVDVYLRNSNTPLFSLNLPGSVFDLDMSADGQKVVAGSKAVHANTFGNGGKINLIDLGFEDFALRTVPHLGATLTFNQYAAPNQTCVLLRALAEQNPPTTFPGVGTLYIQRSTLTLHPLGNADPSGFAQGTFALGTSPSLLGTSLFFQGLGIHPRVLSLDWVKATIVP
jgi:hypothetical protein